MMQLSVDLRVNLINLILSKRWVTKVLGHGWPPVLIPPAALLRFYAHT
jgi:hypothetical protein